MQQMSFLAFNQDEKSQTEKEERQSVEDKQKVEVREGKGKKRPEAKGECPLRRRGPNLRNEICATAPATQRGHSYEEMPTLGPQGRCHPKAISTRLVTPRVTPPVDRTRHSNTATLSRRQRKTVVPGRAQNVSSY